MKVEFENLSIIKKLIENGFYGKTKKYCFSIEKNCFEKV